jgi:predicted amidohydrolase
MSKDITVALVSQVLHLGDKEANLWLMEQALSQEAGSGIDLFVFSEVNINGGFWKEGSEAYPSLSEAVPEGKSCRRVEGLAQRYRTVICAGIIEKFKGHHFITHFLCGPEGYIGKQRKLFAQAPDQNGVLANGKRLCKFELFGYSCVILACADFLFPEPAILAGLSDISLILSPADGFAEHKAHIVQTLLSARALDAQAYAVATFSSVPEGRSLAGLAVSPVGEPLAFGIRDAGESQTLRVRLKLDKPRRQNWASKSRLEVLTKALPDV